MVESNDCHPLAGRTAFWQRSAEEPKAEEDSFMTSSENRKSGLCFRRNMISQTKIRWDLARKKSVCVLRKKSYQGERSLDISWPLKADLRIAIPIDPRFQDLWLRRVRLPQ